MPEINFSIRVIDEDGDGIEYAEVMVFTSDALGLPGSNYEEETDDDGWANFTHETYMRADVSVKIFINGQPYGYQLFSDEDTTSFTLTDD